MRILMVTNTYLPFTSGVTRSIETFTRQYRNLGHEIRIIAPTFEGQQDDPIVVRVPAIHRFNKSDFSVRLPIPFVLSDFMEDFRPEVIHSHHPFLLGNTALRLAAQWEVPLIYTFHTFYEYYVHYFPGGNTQSVKRFAVLLAAGYANLCDHVIAPSTFVKEELTRRKVTKPIDVIPTGINTDIIGKGAGPAFREKRSIPQDAFVVGFVSRLAQEKNLPFLCDAVLPFLSQNEKAYFLLAGTGPLEADLKKLFEKSGLGHRVQLLGNLEGRALYGFYRAMDVFAFASYTETQGLVVAEAMAASTPVVALKAPGVEDVVQDAVNGRLLEKQDREEFTRALTWLTERNKEQLAALRSQARRTAKTFSAAHCARLALSLYEKAGREVKALHEHESAWDEFLHLANAEWNLLTNFGNAVEHAWSEDEKEGF